MVKREKKENIFDAKIKISTVLLIIVVVAILWFFITAKGSADRYERYKNELDSLDTRLQKIATGEFSYLRTGHYTTQEAMQEVYELEKEYEELLFKISFGKLIRGSFEGTRELILDIRMESVEFAILLEEQIILKVHKIGWSYEGEQYTAFLRWSWDLNEIEREREFEKIRLGSN